MATHKLQVNSQAKQVKGGEEEGNDVQFLDWAGQCWWCKLNTDHHDPR